VSTTPLTPSYRAGSGSPLVLLHGFTTSWRIWNPVLRSLGDHHTVLAPTLPGHRGGPPFPPDVRVSVATLADALERFLDAEAVDTAHIAGNSLGGWLSLELARRGRARSVVALAPAGGWDETLDVRKTADQIRHSARLAGLLAPFARLPLAIPDLRRTLLRSVMERGDRMPAADAIGLFSDAGGCDIVDAFAAATRTDGPFMGDLAKVTAPIRIAWSQNDRLLAADAHGRPLLGRIPTAEFVVLPRVGHTPMYDDPLLVVSTILETTLGTDARWREPERVA